MAIPLAAAGVEVHGIDASEAMVERLRAKPGGEAIPVTIGDFRDFSLETAFSVIYVPFNTFFGLLTQDDQVTCFRTVARHLTPDGVFVMEAFVPDLARFDRGQRVSAIRVEPDGVSLDVSIYDPAAQVNDTQHVVIREDGVRLYPVRIRFAFVPELDLMARLAGLRLRERWADWDRTPFSGTSGKHISVWELRPRRRSLSPRRRCPRCPAARPGCTGRRAARDPLTGRPQRAHARGSLFAHVAPSDLPLRSARPSLSSFSRCARTERSASGSTSDG